MHDQHTSRFRCESFQSVEGVDRVRFLFRCVQLLGLILGGLVLAGVLLLDWNRRIRRDRIARHWSRRLIRVLNLDVHVRGEFPPGAALLASNHVSWLDIPIILSQVETRFVSKSEVRRWPIAGWLADAAGTFYIRRGSGTSRPLLNRLIPHLQTGGKVCAFPEGTTTDGTRVQPFHARMFCASIESGCDVVPVALRYGPSVNGDKIAPFIGEDDLFSHLIRVLKTPRLRVDLTVCAPVASESLARGDLARSARRSVCTALCLEMHAG